MASLDFRALLPRSLYSDADFRKAQSNFHASDLAFREWKGGFRRSESDFHDNELEFREAETGFLLGAPGFHEAEAGFR